MSSSPNEPPPPEEQVVDEATGPSETEDFRSGFIALVGRPNAGKSTLLNQVLGQKLAITSNKPQTTRNRIVGIHSAPGLQAVLVDTPGIHSARDAMNRAMVQVATAALDEVDAVCWVVDLVPLARRVEKGGPVFDKPLHAIGRMLSQATERPLSIALNKVDAVPKPWILPIMEAFSGTHPAASLVPLSALTGDNVHQVEGAWRSQLPPGPPLFPTDQITASSERFVVAELIREKVFRLTSREVPYSTAVEVEKFEESPPGAGYDRGRITIYARILVERDGQKRIVVGRGGQMIKRIGTLARQEIQNLLGAKVHLELHVSVQKDWTRNPRVLRELGIG